MTQFYEERGKKKKNFIIIIIIIYYYYMLFVTRFLLEKEGQVLLKNVSKRECSSRCACLFCVMWQIVYSEFCPCMVVLVFIL
jgi:hypothetical protein